LADAGVAANAPSPYSPTVLDHYQNPRNVGAIEDADAVGVVENPACGDVLHLYLRVDGGTITRATFRSFGCVAAIAAGSRLTELLATASVEWAEQLGQQDVVAALDGLPPMKLHAAALAQAAVRAALSDLSRRRGATAWEGATPWPGIT
jgi:nitrogen fixation NifU-like protein